MERFNLNYEDVEHEPVFNLETVERVIRQLEGPSCSGRSSIRNAIKHFIHLLDGRMSFLFKEK